MVEAVNRVASDERLTGRYVQLDQALLVLRHTAIADLIQEAGLHEVARLKGLGVLPAEE